MMTVKPALEILPAVERRMQYTILLSGLVTGTGITWFGFDEQGWSKQYDSGGHGNGM